MKLYEFAGAAGLAVELKMPVGLSEKPAGNDEPDEGAHVHV